MNQNVSNNNNNNNNKNNNAAPNYIYPPQYYQYQAFAIPSPYSMFCKVCIYIFCIYMLYNTNMLYNANILYVDT